MKNIYTKTAKIGVVFALVLMTVVSVTAQISLRKALDFDGDNRADYSVMRPTNNVWYIRGSGGGNTFQQFGNSTSDYQAPGDFDGDNKGDISVWRETDGVWYRLNSSNNTFNAVQFGATGDEAVARDYDGDGKTDQAVIRRSNNVITWYILRSTNGSLFAAQFGASPTAAPDYVAPGDYDGDGRFDLAVQRPGANPTDPAIFYILQSSNNALLSISWGFGNDLVVPGDYDGDGKTDIAVARETGTNNAAMSWFIRQSSNGALKAAQFGTSDDLTVQGDYDGDGKTDIAVWRDPNGTFYVLRSSDNGVTTTQWGAPLDNPIAWYDTH